MAYYDPDDETELQILNMLRDLLEADPIVRARYPEPKKIYPLQTNNVSSNDDLRVSLVFARGDASVAATETNFVVPTLFLVVQKFCSTQKKGTEEEENALKICANVTGAIKRVLVSKYKSQPSPLLPGQDFALWDALTFPGASLYVSDEKGYYMSETPISLSSYQPNI